MVLEGKCVYRDCVFVSFHILLSPGVGDLGGSHVNIAGSVACVHL